MNALIFNTSLMIGWLLIVVGVGGLVSVWAALVTGGVLLVAITLLLARWAGVVSGAPRKARGPNVPQ